VSHDQLEMFGQPVIQDHVGEDGHLCVKCDTIKHVSNFEVTPSGEVKRRCNACVNKQSKIINRLKKENPYPDEDYSCPVCDRKINDIGLPDRKMLYRWVLDHCHDTETFRGYVCHNCNTGLGAFKDNLIVIKNAVRYLERHKNEISS